MLTTLTGSLLDLLFALPWAALGWALGLGLNRLAHALTTEVSPLAQPVCPTCQATIPFVSMWSRACRSCGSQLAYERLEWLLAPLFALLALKFGPGGPLIAYSLYTVSLALTAVIDLRYRFIYTVVSAPSIVVALILTPLLTGVDLMATLMGTGIALGLFLGFYLLGRLVYRDREPVGKGDIELAAVIGAMVGFPRVFSALFLGSFVNGIIIAVLLLARRRGRLDFIPYGAVHWRIRDLFHGTIVTRYTGRPGPR